MRFFWAWIFKLIDKNYLKISMEKYVLMMANFLSAFFIIMHARIMVSVKMHHYKMAKNPNFLET